LDAVGRLSLDKDDNYQREPDHHIGMAGLEKVLKGTTNLDLDEQTAMVLEILKDVCARANTPANDDMTLVGLEVLQGAERPVGRDPGSAAMTAEMTVPDVPH